MKSPSARAMLEHVGQASAIGAPATVKRKIAAFLDRTGADEIILAGSTYDPQDRLRSVELAMDCLPG